MTYDNDDCTIYYGIFMLVIIGMLSVFGYNVYTIATTTPNGMIVTNTDTQETITSISTNNTTNILTNNTMNLSTDLKFAESIFTAKRAINRSENFVTFHDSNMEYMWRITSPDKNFSETQATIKINRSYIVNITETPEHLIIELRR